MRGLLVPAALLLLCVPAANAQMTPTLDLQVDAPTDPVGPEGAKVVLTLRMVCPNQATVLPDQVIGIAFRGPAGSIYDGPESFMFSSHPCLAQTYDEQVGEYLVKLPADANGSTVFSYRVEAYPQGGYNPLTPPPNGAQAEFALASPPAPPAPELAPLAEDCTETLSEAAEEAAADPKVANVPGLGWLAPLAGIAVALVRRRSA